MVEKIEMTNLIEDSAREWFEEGANHIRFEYSQVFSHGKKLPVFVVVNRKSGSMLGQLKWYSKWRQYCFFPNAVTVFNSSCLRSINDRISYLGATHRHSLKEQHG